MHRPTRAILATCITALMLLVAASPSLAAVVAIKRDAAGFHAHTNMNATFRTAVTDGTIVVYTDASTGADVVDDATISWHTGRTYANFGAAVSSIGPWAAYKFNTSVLPGFLGGRVLKAEMQIYNGSGNEGVNMTRITTCDWAEGNKLGGTYDNPTFPGADLTASGGGGPAPGCSYAHPIGIHTANNRAADNTTPTPTNPAQSWGVARNTYFSIAGDTGGTPVGGSFASYSGTNYSTASPTSDTFGRWDMVEFAQAWANGTPNYGVAGAQNNRPLYFSEAGTVYQPVLFIEYEPNGQPDAITNLASANVDWFQLDLTWTAPTDAPVGPCTYYEIRCSTSEITDANWDSATLLTGAPTPADPGTTQTFTVTSLQPETDYYFAMKAFDITNWASNLSNVLMVRTQPMETYAPATITDLAVVDTRPNHVIVTFSAVGDDGMNGLAAGYELRYSTNPIYDANFVAATLATTGTPKAPGQLETVRITGLTPSTSYYLAVKARDEVPNWSALSNVPFTTSLAADSQAPNTITDLAVTATHIRAVMLRWTTPADNGAAGCALYDVRYGTSPVGESNWSTATQVADEPTPAAPGITQQFLLQGLQAGTTYYFAVKTIDHAEPVNVSAISNSAIGLTLPPSSPIAVVNPWLTNDRVGDTRTLASTAATFVNAYTPEGTVAPADNQAKAINLYNNIKRRLYHWANVPPSADDTVRNLNVFGWGLCGNHRSLSCTIGNAAGFAVRQVDIPNTHWIYEINYDGSWHFLDTMTTMYVFNRQGKISNVSEMRADKTLINNAVAEGRACPGFLLCNDPVGTYANWMDVAVVGSTGSGVWTPTWSMNHNIRFGEGLKRTCESMASQHPTGSNPDAPFHHDAQGDFKDPVNFPYWEPYTIQMKAYNSYFIPTYRRWANGTYDIKPDFRVPAWSAPAFGAPVNLTTTQVDENTGILHPAAAGTNGEVAFKIALPFYITDCNISGDFFRNDSADSAAILTSTNGTSWTTVWTASQNGTTNLSNFNIRNSANGKAEFYVKIQLKAVGAITEASVKNLVISTIYEHNKGSMAYLDKGVNHITLTLDNPQDLNASTLVKVTYKWKEFDGTDWTVDKSHTQYVATSPATFTIVTGGTKVPRTESVNVEVTEPPMPDPDAPSAVTDLTAPVADTTMIGLAWTATGDDGLVGQAGSYDIRYSTAPISEADWASATQATGEPGPLPSGSSETFTVTGLQPSTLYYFALKVLDEGGNISPISNVVTQWTAAPDVTPPAPIYSLVGRRGAASGSVELTFKASGDDGQTGTATSYDIRYSTAAITEANWAAATQVTGEPTPAAPGTKQAFTVTGLTAGTEFFFAIKAADEVPNVAAISNCAPATASIIGEKVLQRGLNSYFGVKDTYMVANSSTNYATQSLVRVCGFQQLYGLAGTQRGLVSFDLATAGIPAGTPIASARLSLYSYNLAQIKGTGGAYSVHRVTKSWTETGAHWTNYASGSAWTTPGGDFEATADANTPRRSVVQVGWYDFDVTSRVQDWINGAAGNYGWLVKETDEYPNHQDEFASSDYGTQEFKPKLVVSDLPPLVAGDVTDDGHVDVVDLLWLVDAFGKAAGEAGFDPRCDFNDDDWVDVVDLLTMVENWGV